jgi:hypothetical protein
MGTLRQLQPNSASSRIHHREASDTAAAVFTTAVGGVHEWNFDNAFSN